MPTDISADFKGQARQQVVCESAPVADGLAAMSVRPLRASRRLWLSCCRGCGILGPFGAFASGRRHARTCRRSAHALSSASRSGLNLAAEARVVPSFGHNAAVEWRLLVVNRSIADVGPYADAAASATPLVRALLERAVGHCGHGAPP